MGATSQRVERTVERVVHGDEVHWVGDGFRVSSLLTPEDGLSPFLLLDHHAPYDYAPTDRPRGVGVHPHRGFETVTLAFEGSVAHHDSTGAGGLIRAGDVQWMTAASGILHEEHHEAEWARRGGRFHMVQLWVNLPADRKMDAPAYQPLTAEQIGSRALPDGAGTIRVIAGAFGGHHGPARTATPVELWDVLLDGSAPAALDVPPDHTASVLVLEGEATVAGTAARHGDLVVLDRTGETITVAPEGPSRLLVLGGEPIDEPVVAYGPFVMNTREQVIEAIDDFERGRFGHLV